MKISVIGTINKDLILPFKGSPIESFGGIFYDITVLSNLVGPDDIIQPISHVGEDVFPTISAVLSKMPAVSLDGLIEVEGKNHKVILEYTAPERRQEKSLFQFPSLGYEQIAPHLVDSDMIIINMVSGWDLSLETYQKISDLYFERLYLDVHYLLMGLDTLGRRSPRLPEHFEQWLAGARFVQMNEDEFGLLAQESRNEIDFYQTYFKPAQTLINTLASKGARAVYERDGMVGSRTYEAYDLPVIVDTTGCGDSFGAGFCVKYLQSDDVATAIDFANLVAASNASMRGTNEMHRLNEIMDTLRRAKGRSNFNS